MENLATVLILATLVSSGQAEFDHTQQNCVDVSIYEAVSYEDADCEKCETEFQNECTNRVETKCDNVTDTVCRIQAFSECSASTKTVTFETTEMIPDGQYIPYECTESTRLEPHKKLIPVCVNVTRQDCVTKWEVDAFGNKKWAGNDDCKPVTWQDCKLTEITKNFNQTYTECKRTGVPLPTIVCKPASATKEVMVTKCTVKHVKACEFSTSEKCGSVTVQECEEKPKPVACTTDTVRVPTQKKVHRVKCLLGGQNESPQLNVDVAAADSDNKLPDNPQGTKAKRSLRMEPIFRDSHTVVYGLEKQDDATNEDEIISVVLDEEVLV